MASISLLSLLSLLGSSFRLGARHGLLVLSLSPSVFLCGCAGGSRDTELNQTGESSSVGNESGAGVSTPSRPTPCESVMTATECEMFEAINQIRISNQIPPLKILSNCVAAAHAHDDDMGARGYFSHDSPDETWQQRMTRFGLTGGAVGENIAKGGDVSQTVSQCMNSPGHRANILNATYRTTGVGRGFAASGQQFWVQCFSSRTADL